MHIAIHPHTAHEHHHLPHQGTWFVFMLMMLLMLLSAMVAATLLA
jgi:hypothetical protein